MNDKSFIQEKMIDRIEDRLTAAEREKFDRLLAADSAIRDTYERLKAVYTSGDNMREIEPSLGFYSRLNSQIQEYESNNIRFSDLWQIFSGKLRPALASAALLVAIFLGYFMGSGAIATASESDYSPDDYVTQYFGLDNFELDNSLTVPQVYYDLLNGETGND